MTSLAQRIIAENSISLEFIKGHMSGGVPFFAYVVMKKSDADKAREQTVGLSIPPSAIILYSDYGHDVCPTIEEQVLGEYRRMLKN